MNARRIIAAALTLPVTLAGGATVLVLSGTTAAASTASTPITSSTKHPHESVTCTPGTISRKGHCQIRFSDKDPNEKPKAGQTVCFTVNPTSAGTITTASGGNCTTTNSAGGAFGTFTADSTCGKATITANEPNERKDKGHSTVVTIKCPAPTAPKSSAAPIAVPNGPTGGSGFEMGAVGLLMAATSAFGLRTRRFVLPWRLPANLPA